MMDETSMTALNTSYGCVKWRCKRTIRGKNLAKIIRIYINKCQENFYAKNQRSNYRLGKCGTRL